MSILLEQDTRVLVQGITGRDGSFHALSMLDYGGCVVGGVTPGRGGQTVGSLPVFESVKEAVAETGATCSTLFVPAKFATSAIREAADAGIELIVCITEGIPVLESIANCRYVEAKGARLIGPNCPGLISPGKGKAGILPGHIHRPGSVGVISRSGTLTYEVVHNLSVNGVGQSTCVGIGGDPVVGTRYIELLQMFDRDPETEAVVLIGEIGGNDEENAAAFIRSDMKKKVVAFISGRTAPPGKRMGHAGAIISGGQGGATAKVDALRAAGVTVVDRPDAVASAL
ncbi:MAG: succinate--CoA ligase subunit alpha [Lentisphaerae bacterium]|jgi:succinyl-CoA synthetase alpha subunit|nr:succinate--CoA ligase subunit alpha [Lentisphaerota bacterium]MBT4819235.1 succinate--CoA ligase subunit alpha [Lentisphaerota bacterium]MBT5604993.1 succinate--CoA ligase subunit alpha [Lentisphaerota bacterium]MBT7054623.1 succinate--CoA ligase subunit alpha [Lentisphaerota bacterium]MBT7844652.1 succinate--CoA ligase subunit alpha [Lentisphaerota bacterium]